MRGIWKHGGVVLYNSLFTFVPSHAFRCAMLRIWGAQIGAGSAIQLGTTVLGIENLRVGSNTRIGSRCLLDARGGLSVGDGVVVSDDTQFITAHHDPQSNDFTALSGAIRVEDSAWIAARATVLEQVTVGRGAVVGACSLVRADVGEREIAAGIPARTIGRRTSQLTYRVTARRAFA